MKILILESNEEKFNKLKNAIEKSIKQRIEIKRYENIKNILIKENYDLIILGDIYLIDSLEESIRIIKNNTKLNNIPIVLCSNKKEKNIGETYKIRYKEDIDVLKEIKHIIRSFTILEKAKEKNNLLKEKIKLLEKINNIDKMIESKQINCNHIKINNTFCILCGKENAITNYSLKISNLYKDEEYKILELQKIVLKVLKKYSNNITINNKIVNDIQKEIDEFENNYTKKIEYKK